MKLFPGYDPKSQEALLYEELAPLLVTEERYSPAAYASKVLHLPLPEITRVYGEGAPNGAA